MSVAEGVALGGRPRTHRDMMFVWQTVRYVLVMCVSGVAVDRAHTVKAAKLDPLGRGAQYSAKDAGWPFLLLATLSVHGVCPHGSVWQNGLPNSTLFSPRCRL